MNPLPLLFLLSAGNGRTRTVPPVSLPPVDLLADRLHSLTAAVDQMAALSHTLQALPGLAAVSRPVSSALPASVPLSSAERSDAPASVPAPQNTPYAAPPQAVPFSGPPEAFGSSLSAMAQKLPSNIGQLLTPDLLQKVSALLGK